MRNADFGFNEAESMGHGAQGKISNWEFRKKKYKNI